MSRGSEIGEEVVVDHRLGDLELFDCLAAVKTVYRRLYPLLGCGVRGLVIYPGKHVPRDGHLRLCKLCGLVSKFVSNMLLERALFVLMLLTISRPLIIGQGFVVDRRDIIELRDQVPGTSTTRVDLCTRGL